MKLSGLEEIERWVLSWGTRATVINLPQLAKRIGNIARQRAKRYSEPDLEI
jgi:hypothetical protein